MIKDIKEVKECPECGSDNIVRNEKRQQVLCKDCGMIFEPMSPDKEEKFEKAAAFRRKL